LPAVAALAAAAASSPTAAARAWTIDRHPCGRAERPRLCTAAATATLCLRPRLAVGRVAVRDAAQRERVALRRAAGARRSGVAALALRPVVAVVQRVRAGAVVCVTGRRSVEPVGTVAIVRPCDPTFAARTTDAHPVVTRRRTGLTS